MNGYSSDASSIHHPISTSSQIERRGHELTSEREHLSSQTGVEYDAEQNGGSSVQTTRVTATPLISQVVDTTAEKVCDTFANFLTTFVDQDGEKYYMQQIMGLETHGLRTLYVDYVHLTKPEYGVLAQAITEQYYRFLPFLQKALRTVRRQLKYDRGGSHSHAPENTLSASSIGSSIGSKDERFDIAFYNLPVVNRIRDLKTAKVGQLMSFSGTVTRSSEVRPELFLATFTCDNCHTVVENVEQVFKYTLPQQCPNMQCQNRLAWTLNTSKSEFVDWQKVRVQENSNEIPTGSMPRTIDVILRGEVVDRAKAGDKCVFTGTAIVVPDVSQLGLPGVKPQAIRDTRSVGRGIDGVTGLKMLGARDLTYRMAFLACLANSESKDKRSDDDEDKETDVDDFFGNRAQMAYLNTLTASELSELEEMVQSPSIYADLVASIAPTVFGHDMIKKGILLQLMGGVHKITEEGIRLRGDINVCIVGDPSTSKSQFLKYVCSFLPRSVYTSGKASSAAGLTAAVVKDEETGEFTIEAGALMLADNGICAIDEFDKMDVADQVAIHEAMEQQTISMAKAGIHATLNARASILAAANPIGGRYNRKTSLRANINMSAPIMSRFDLFFVILDDANSQIDERLANHIVDLHMSQDEAINPKYSTEQLQRFIGYAKTFKPQMTRSARDAVVELYKDLRAADSNGVGRNSYRITVRQLESMVRLSEAIAKANCTNEITVPFVREAYNLLRQSIVSVEMEDINLDENEGAQTMAPPHPQALEERDMATPRQKTAITHELFSAISSAAVELIKQDDDNEGDGVTIDQIKEYYLEKVEDTLETREEVMEQSALVEKVVKRLVRDNVIMMLTGDYDSLIRSGEASRAKRYVLHPNSVHHQ